MISTIRTAILALAITSLNTAAQTLPGGGPDGLAAVVNGKVIARSEVQTMVIAQEQLARIKFRNDKGEMSRQIDKLHTDALDLLIDRELMMAEFEKLGGQIKDHFVDDEIDRIVRENFNGEKKGLQEALSANGMSMPKFREMQQESLIIRFMRQSQVGQLPPVTPEQIEAEYKANIDKFRSTARIKLRTITIPKFTADATTTEESQKALANDIRSKIVSGADFAETAETHSADSRATEGGDWGWVEEGTTLKDSMHDVAFALGHGDVSPVVDDERAYIIMWIEARQNGKVAPLSEVSDTVEKFVRQKRGKEMEQQWLERLRLDAVIEKF